MSLFSTPDPHATDARRKQLLAKLMQQRGAGGTAPVPHAAGGVLGAVGRGFRNSDSRHTGSLNQTQHDNVLPSVLARLGISGHGGQNEVSPSDGVPISNPGAAQGGHGVNPFEVSPSDHGPPPGVGPAVGPAAAPDAPAAADPFVPAAAPTAPAATDLTVDPGTAGFDGTQGTLDSSGFGPNTSNLPPGPGGSFDPPATDIAPPGLVPLGNGMFYDPVTDAVRGGGALGFGRR